MRDRSKVYVVVVALVLVLGLMIFVIKNLNTGDEINGELDKVEVASENGKISALFKAHGLIPLNNEEGAYGYGIITNKGTDAVIVSTTHSGVLDSELQRDENDPVWHNHLVKLGEVEECDGNLGVIDITWESPGKVDVMGSALEIRDFPSEFRGTHSLTKKTIYLAPGTRVEKAVRFKLEPKFNEKNELIAVCVTDISEANFELRSVNES
ncbi:hypothetical protein D6817_01030 [Candidatus Pacearchaeota archaeon]|nr:MAG: hypothetical protein D6817_01030 [Candidatus Pacearchaeota archaeon]